MRIVVTLALMVAVTGAGQAVHVTHADARSQDQERVIPVSGGTSISHAAVNESGEGEPCYILTQTAHRSQIIIRDEVEAIIVARTIEGEFVLTEDGIWRCDFDYEIPVPDAAFYSVFVGQTRLYTFSADAFPIDSRWAITVPEA